MSKIYLTKKEKQELFTHKSIIIERDEYLPTPKTSIMYGVGIQSIFDKVDYRWVYGDIDAYISDKMNVGRRETDYPNNKINRWSGCEWWGSKKKYNSFGAIADTVMNGRLYPTIFKILDDTLSLQPNNTDYLTVRHNLKIELIRGFLK
jgi:hypothetical protein